jgi:prevent-host-death family protein
MTNLRGQLANVLEAMERGEEIVITRHGKPIGLITGISVQDAGASLVRAQREHGMSRGTEISEPTLAQVKAKDKAQRELLSKVNRKPRT